MNSILSRAGAVLVAALLFTACTQEELGNGTTTTELKKQTEVVKGTVDMVVDYQDKPETRVSLKYTEGQGVKYIFKKNEKLRLYALFVQTVKYTDGSSDIIKKVSDKDSLKVLDVMSGNRYKAEFDLTVPEGVNIDLKAGDSFNNKTVAESQVEVTGAVGVRGINEEGKADVKWYGKNSITHVTVDGNDIEELKNEYDITGDDGYCVPMYFPLTKVNDRKEVGAHFQNYGSIVHMLVRSELFDPYLPRVIDVKTDAFFSEGTMDLLSAHGSYGPLFTTTQQPGTVKRYPINIDNLLEGEAQLAVIYLWVKPNPVYAGQHMPCKVAFEQELSDHDIQALDPQTVYYKNVKVEENKVHTLNVKVTSDLIFTEIYLTGFTGGNNIWEIYNPTTHPIDLRDYHIVMRHYGPEYKDKLYWCPLWPCKQDLENTAGLLPWDPRINNKMRYNVTSTFFIKSGSGPNYGGNIAARSDYKDYMLQPGKFLIVAARATVENIGLTATMRENFDKINLGSKLIMFDGLGGWEYEQTEGVGSNKRVIYDPFKNPNIMAFRQVGVTDGREAWWGIAKKHIDWDTWTAESGIRPTEDDVIDNFMRRPNDGKPGWNDIAPMSIARKPSSNLPRKYAVAIAYDDVSQWLRRDGWLTDMPARFRNYWSAGNAQTKASNPLNMRFFSMYPGGGVRNKAYALPRYWNSGVAH